MLGEAEGVNVLVTATVTTEADNVVVTATVTVGAACADEPGRVTVAGVSVVVTVTD